MMTTTIIPAAVLRTLWANSFTHFAEKILNQIAKLINKTLIGQKNILQGF